MLIVVNTRKDQYLPKAFFDSFDLGNSRSYEFQSESGMKYSLDFRKTSVLSGIFAPDLPAQCVRHYSVSENFARLGTAFSQIFSAPGTAPSEQTKALKNEMDAAIAIGLKTANLLAAFAGIDETYCEATPKIIRELSALDGEISQCQTPGQRAQLSGRLETLRNNYVEKRVAKGVPPFSMARSDDVVNAYLAYMQQRLEAANPIRN
jgi:hypothetical protein